MKAVILAAGKGTRMRHLTHEAPKPLLPLNGKSILEHTLDSLVPVADEARIVIGYKGKMIQDKIGERYGGLPVSYVWQKEQNGTGDAARRAALKLTDPFLLMYGDDFYAAKDIKKVCSRFPCILGAVSEHPENFGVLEVEQGRVVGLEEKPERPKSSLVNAGLYHLDASVFDAEIEKSARGEYELTDYIALYIKRKPLYYVETTDWIPISTPEMLKDAEDALT